MEYLAMIPSAIPAIVLAVGILWFFVGLPVPIYGTAAILVIAYFIRFVGLGVRQSRTALSQISEELPEAARMCGASPLRAFYDVTVPLVQPAALALWTLLFMSIFTEISVTILLYNFNTITLPVQLWNDMSAGHQTRAFATAMLQASVIFIVIFAANRKFGILRNTLGR
jgi:iron(III) transport system permease protein